MGLPGCYRSRFCIFRHADKSKLQQYRQRGFAFAHRLVCNTHLPISASGERLVRMKSILVSLLCLTVLISAQAQTQLKPPTESAMDRFLRYVKIDTQSQEDQTTVPSTRKQLNLANLLAKELTALGAQNVRVSEFGIVYATVPGNLADNSKVPVVGFISHMETSTAVSGGNVNAIVHYNNTGADILLAN